MVDKAEDLEALVRTTQSGRAFGITSAGFVSKPVARLLDESLAAAKLLFGEDLDLTSGSVVRKIAEMTAMEHARCWEHLGRLYESNHVALAKGDALSMLGAELGIPRPHHRARGTVEISLAQDLPNGTTELVLQRGTRILTSGGHDYFLTERAELTNSVRTAEVSVRAFYPGPEMNLDPNLTVDGVNPQKLDRFNEYDGRSHQARSLGESLGSPLVTIDHKTPTSGGELYWDDETYRDLLLAYPRNLWTPDAIRVAVALVPGVRQVLVKDRYGGLDIHQSIFGNFNFIERLFSEERSLGSPYFVTALVAKDEGAIWEGPEQLWERANKAVDQVRPIGIYVNIEPANEVGVAFQCEIAVEGVPIPAGTPTAINDAPEALALKQRILNRVRRYVQSLGINEPVLYSEVFWAVMEEPGVVDCKRLRLHRYPPKIDSLDLNTSVVAQPQVLGFDEDVNLGPTEIAVLVEKPRFVKIV